MLGFVFAAAAWFTVQDAPPLSANPCGEYEAAIAPLNSQSVLCGISVEDDTLVVHYPDGRTFLAAENLRIPQRFSATDVNRFWVMDAGHSRIVGLRGSENQTVMLVARDESGDAGWFATPVQCGEYGPDHVYPFSGESEYAFAAYSLEGHFTFCALGTTQHNQARFSLENGADTGLSLDRLSIRSWYCGGEEFEPSNICFTVIDPAGNEIFRHEGS